MDDATQRRRLRNEVKQSRQLQVILAHATLVPAFLDVWTRFEHCPAGIHSSSFGIESWRSRFSTRFVPCA
jgi:hypothetical protein